MSELKEKASAGGLQQAYAEDFPLPQAVWPPEDYRESHKEVVHELSAHGKELPKNPPPYYDPEAQWGSRHAQQKSHDSRHLGVCFGDHPKQSTFSTKHPRDRPLGVVDRKHTSRRWHWQHRQHRKILLAALFIIAVVVVVAIAVPVAATLSRQRSEAQRSLYLF